jgi:hypothetical protein
MKLDQLENVVLQAQHSTPMETVLNHLTSHEQSETVLSIFNSMSHLISEWTEMQTTHFALLKPPLALLKEGAKKNTNVSTPPPTYSLVVDVLPSVRGLIVPRSKELDGWVVSRDNVRFTRVQKDTNLLEGFVSRHKNGLETWDTFYV